VEAAYDPNGHEVYKWKAPRKKEKVDISAEVLEMAKKALAGVVQEGGTAGRLAAYEVKMGGKTGTAQVVSLDSACVGEKCRDHAWFVGFAPTDKPEIAAAVVVEHGGFGASAAAPIVGAIMQRYMDIKNGTESKHPSLSHVYKQETGDEG
jgi:penicillin-binding protein 2